MPFYTTKHTYNMINMLIFASIPNVFIICVVFISKGFGKPLTFSAPEVKIDCSEDLYVKNRKFSDLLKEHVDQAFETGFNDNLTKFKGKHHFVVSLSLKS